MSFIYKNEIGEEILLTSNKIKLINHNGMSGLDNSINSIKSSNQNGSTYVNSSIEEREIKLTLRILANLEEYRTIKRKLFTVFNPAYQGELILKNTEGEKKLCTRVTYSPNFIIDGNKKECEINLVALDPYWRDINETKTDIASWKGSFSFPLMIPLDTGIMIGYREPSLIANVNNIGDIKTGMRIEFKALSAVINPQLINIETQDYIKINKTMEAGEVITVTTDFSNKRVSISKNGVLENGFNYFDLYSTFLQLEIGDNLFRYNAQEGLESLEVTIYHTSRYLGV